MHKVVINDDFGGFGLSEKARNWLERVVSLCPMELWDTARASEFKYEMVNHMPRHHPMLVACVEEFGYAANAEGSSLKVVEIPGSQYIISQRDGHELVTAPESIEWLDVHSFIGARGRKYSTDL